MRARDAILGALPDTDSPAIAAEAAALLVTPERPALTGPTLEAAFLERLAQPAVAASHDHVETLADLPAAIARYLGKQGLPATLCLPPASGLHGCDWTGFVLHEQCAPDEAAALGIARCAVAETGSLIFETAPYAPMLPNFLALHHIVLLRADAIVAHLEDAILPEPQPRAHYWITGVSGTTDIEGQYVRGAHGPRFLHVILLG